MSAKEKLIDRFKKQPKDFTFNELTTLLKGLGYTSDNKGKTSGSRIAFVNPETGHRIGLHRPHPSPTLKSRVIENIIAELEREGYFDGK